MNKYLEENLKEIDYDTSKWQLVMIRLSEDNSTAFATFRFNQRNKEKKENKVNYINFIRDCRETKSFYSWKILQNSLIQKQREIKEMLKLFCLLKYIIIIIF